MQYTKTSLLVSAAAGSGKTRVLVERLLDRVTGEGLDQLKAKLPELIAGNRKILHLVLPPFRADLAAFAHAVGEVYEEEYAPDGVLDIVVAVEEKHCHKFADYLK